MLVRTVDQRPRRAWERRLGLEPGALPALVFDGPVSREATLGRAQVDDVWDDVARRLALSPAQAAELRRDFWRGDRLDADLVAYIRVLRPARKTALITNAWPDARQRIVHEWKLADAFDEIVISAEVGLAKPDEAIYRKVLDRCAVQPGEMVFVDDFPRNVSAAGQMGIRTITFRTSEQALRELRTMLSPVPPVV